ncbi:sigma-70 family RNA polymerase sigma factor [Bailinhaonella thermotolerans]|nr:sigma-70 domain-containing protein [Bailinhaonella thermotolerans]
MSEESNDVREANHRLRREYLALQAELGTGPGERRARALRSRMSAIAEEIMRTNKGLAGEAIRRFARPGDTEDLHATAMLKLWECFLAWDPDQGASLATVARKPLMGAVNRQVAADNGIKYHDWTERPGILRTIEELAVRLGRSPTDREVAQATGLSADAVAQARRPAPASLDAPVGQEGEATLADLLDPPGEPAVPEDPWPAGVLDVAAAELPLDQLLVLAYCDGLAGSAPLPNVMAAQQLGVGRGVVTAARASAVANLSRALAARAGREVDVAALSEVTGIAERTLRKLLRT